MRFVSYMDRKPIAGALKEVYTTSTVEAAELALLGKRYPAAVAV